MKTAKLLLPLLVALAYAPAQVMAGTSPLLEGDLNSLTVYSDTYTSMGANSIVYGNILAGGVATNGASSKVFGNITTAEAANNGGGGTTATGGSYVSGSIVSGGVLTLGNGGTVDGSVQSSGAGTIGANATVKGDMTSGGVTTIGDTALVGGNMVAGGTATVGANARVNGNVASYNGAPTVSASGSVGGTQTTLSAMPFDPAAYKAAIVSHVATDSNLVSKAQIALHNMADSSAASMGFNTLGQTITSALATTMTVNTTLDAGVYSAPNLSLTAGITLTLDAQNLANQAWVFNITDYLVTGDSVVINIINADQGGASVIWNVLNTGDAAGGYTMVGANTTFIGTILSNIYISVGAGAHVTGVGKSCGGVYSATSYVSGGDSAVIGEVGCTMPATTTPAASVTSVPEPGSLAMLLTGLGLLAFTVRRKKMS